MTISIIIPVLNEGKILERCLRDLQGVRSTGAELILIDGGSDCLDMENIRNLVDIFSLSPKGRAVQMNLGAGMAKNDVLLFLHADTQIPPESLTYLYNKLSEWHGGWGYFSIKLSGRSSIFRVIEKLINLRSRFSRIATGDQAIFVEKRLFNKINGYPEIELMEDIQLSKKLKNITRPLFINKPVITSSRKWETTGILRTILLMWLIRAAYFLGVPAKNLHAIYYPESGKKIE